MPSSNEEGSFERLLNEQKALGRNVAFFEGQVGKEGARALANLPLDARSLEVRIAESQAYLAGKRAELAALDSRPAVREVPTAYPR